MYPAFGWSGGSGPRWISARIGPAKTLGFEEPFFEPGLGCGGRPPRHQDDRLADVGENLLRLGRQCGCYAAGATRCQRSVFGL